MNPEPFSVANGTIGANVTIGRTLVPVVPLVVPVVLLVRPNGVNSNIIISPSNIFLYFFIFYVHISLFLLFAHIILLKTVLIC